MQRFSVSVDDEKAAWIESIAEERGVSKAKVFRDIIETAQFTGLIRSDNIDSSDAESLIERIEMLEKRIEALESAGGHGETDESVKDNLIAAFQRQLVGQPPRKEHGKEAVTRIFELLYTEGPLSTKELRERLYPEFEDHYSNEDSMWQSTQRYLADIDGIVKKQEGMWDADPSAVDTETAELDDWEQS